MMHCRRIHIVSQGTNGKRSLIVREVNKAKSVTNSNLGRPSWAPQCKPHIILKIPSQKHTWSTVKKSKKLNGDLIPLQNFHWAKEPISKTALHRDPYYSENKMCDL